MKYFILLAALFFATKSFSQQANITTELKSSFDLFATKHIYRKEMATELTRQSKQFIDTLTRRSIYRDACQQMGYNAGGGCPVWDYDLYYRKFSGVDTLLYNSYKVVYKYSYETNTRRGTDTATNIDTIKVMAFSWQIKNLPSTMKSGQIKRLYEKMFKDIQAIVNQYNGTGADDSNLSDENPSVKRKFYWGTVPFKTAALRLHFFTDTKNYRLTYAGDVR